MPPRKRSKIAVNDEAEDIAPTTRKGKPATKNAGSRDIRDALKGKKADATNSGSEKEIQNDNGDEEVSNNGEKKDLGGSRRTTRAKRALSSDDEPKPESMKKEKATAKTPLNKRQNETDEVFNFGNDSKTSDGKPWNLKITSWNVNGIRAWLGKNGLNYVRKENPDILCVQETKCSDSKLPAEIKKLDGYHCYWSSAEKEGYSGVGLLSKEKPLDVQYGIGKKEHDTEGRVITAEYETFYLVTSYTPNSGNHLVRLDYRQTWDADFRDHVKNLDTKKPVILCGDLNVAHEEIDLAKPKTNTKNAGFTKEEREGFTVLLSEGFIDTFRKLYPDKKDAYTFWTYMLNARSKNIGWRLDYFVISQRLESSLCDSTIRSEVLGSDHCPVTLFLST